MGITIDSVLKKRGITLSEPGLVQGPTPLKPKNNAKSFMKSWWKIGLAVGGIGLVAFFFYKKRQTNDSFSLPKDG